MYAKGAWPLGAYHSLALRQDHGKAISKHEGSLQQWSSLKDFRRLDFGSYSIVDTLNVVEALLYATHWC
jgi:hypothetical protein